MDDLHPGEEVIFEGHPSWRSTLSFYIKGVGLALVAAALVALITRITDDEVNWGLVVAAFLVIEAIAVLVGFLRRLFTVYTITTQRLRIKRGFIARHVQQTRIDRVQNVNTRQSVIDRMLQVGTVDFDTAGTDDSDFTFVGVGDPSEVVAAVDRAQRLGAAATPSPTGL
jgi:uncharacterized membrane protein YdbT with pleckstrin-like domain